MKVAHIGGDPARLRRVTYMDVGDQLDAIAKGFRALQQQGFLLPAETMEWLEHCEGVKARHPKRPPGDSQQG